MKINIIKDHHSYPLGEQEVTDERAQYLIRMGIAEAVTVKAKEGAFEESEKVIDDYLEEKMITPKKEIKVSPVVAANKSKKAKSK